MAAARAAVRRGAKALLVQAGPIGGECTFNGCVPSKALIAAAAHGTPFDEAMRTVRRSIETIAATEDDEAFTPEAVALPHGWAALRSPTQPDLHRTPPPARPSATP